MSLKRNETEFKKELESLINKYSLENDSNTPDFILAHYLVESLKTFNETSRWREGWFGTNLTIGMNDDKA